MNVEKSDEDLVILKSHRGKLHEVISLLENGADINYTNENGCTALHAAAAAGQLEVVEYLLHYPDIDYNIVDNDDQSALFYAAFHGHLEVVQLLVEHGVPLDMPDKYGRLVHNAAALNGHLDVVSYLLEECSNPININAIDEYGGTCLHWAALKGRKEVVQYLCRKGIDVFLTSYDNRTALQLAKDKHKQKCVQFLKGWLDQLQQFISAAEEGNEADLTRIIEGINDKNILRYLKDKDGKNALHWAASSGHLGALKLLAKEFNLLTDVDKCGRNALHWAALGGHKKCVKWLVGRAKGTTLIHSLTLTNKSPSRCAFEAGYVALAAKLQALEEGHDEVLQQDADMDPMDPPEPPKASGRGMNNVNQWLKTIELEEYTDNFQRDGFDTLRGVATIIENDLVDMSVKKGHRRMVLSRIEDLKQQLAIIDEDSKKRGVPAEQTISLEMLPSLGDISDTKPPATVSTDPPPSNELEDVN